MRLEKGMFYRLKVHVVMFFSSSLIELAELEIKHARTQQDLLKKSVQSLRELL
jgi:hypothetical protein